MPPCGAWQEGLEMLSKHRLSAAELDALERLPFAALWRGMLHLRDQRAAFLFQVWLRSQQLARDREVVAGREQRHGACACLVFLRIRCGLAALLGAERLARVSLCARRLNFLRLCPPASDGDALIASAARPCALLEASWRLAGPRSGSSGKIVCSREHRFGSRSVA